jgi:branched-chain amino acid transport system substrate-binding protein
MSRCIRFVTHALVLLLCVAGCTGKSTPELLLIGHLAPTTATDPARDQARHGIQLAVDEANKEENLVAGRRVQVLHPDCPNEREALRATAVRVLTINKAAALLGGTEPGQVEVLAVVAEAAKVPLIAPGGAPNRAGGGFVFHTGVSPAYLGKILARFAGDQWPGKSVAVLTNLAEGPGPALSSLAAVFGGDFRKSGGRIAGEWTFKNPAELKELVRLITLEKPAAVLLAGTLADLTELRKADLADSLPIVLGTSEGAVAPLQTHPIPNAVYLATSFVAGEGPARVQEFVRLYQERFQQAPDVQAALAYDSARLLFTGFRGAGAVEGEKVRNALADVKKFDSVTGPITFDADHWALRTLFLVRVCGGQAKTIRTYDAGGGGG